MSAPANAKKPQDHQTAKSEALKKEVTIEFNDTTYIVPPDAMNNIEIMEYVEEEAYIKAVKAIIGVTQWQTFKDSNRNDEGHVTGEVFQEFIQELFGALGG